MGDGEKGLRPHAAVGVSEEAVFEEAKKR